MENEIKNAIYFIGKYGVCEHMRHIECNKSFYKEHLYGIAYFINMVDREKGQKYLRQFRSARMGILKYKIFYQYKVEVTQAKACELSSFFI